MRAGSFATQLNKSDIACKVQDLSVGMYEGATRLSSLVCLEQGIPIFSNSLAELIVLKKEGSHRNPFSAHASLQEFPLELSTKCISFRGGHCSSCSQKF